MQSVGGGESREDEPLPIRAQQGQCVGSVWATGPQQGGRWLSGKRQQEVSAQAQDTTKWSLRHLHTRFINRKVPLPP